ncbi:MAG: S46 family peptidase [Robiginitomaculum sp.]|nr:S46 family peptidase [Robiginitomaculum sp.]
MAKRIIGLSAMALSLFGFTALADEGMWTPDQVPQIAKTLKKMGLKLKPSALEDLTAHPMAAIVSLGGCTASFVSNTGLVVTNHHCAYGSIQYNSTADNNLIEKGFFAENSSDELPASPGSIVAVTTAVEDVTAKVNAGLNDEMSSRQRFQAIEDSRKSLVSACEVDEATRCSVTAFHGGLYYYLNTRMTINDVRLVYAPAGAVGKYGGDIDNWMWPRHTGDFAFYRAYVGPDGKPAEFAAENVPFTPKHFLKVQPKGVRAGDFVMAAGYPGRTSRYRRLSEVEHAFLWQYPLMENLIGEWIKTIENNAPKGSDARVKYASLLAGLNNYHKNLGGQMEGARKVDLTGRKAATETALNDWVSQTPKRIQQYQASITELDNVILEGYDTRVRDLYYRYAGGRPALLSVAKRLYRLSIEKQKDDAQRERGFQDRDMRRFTQGMKRIDRRYDPAVDQAVWQMFLGHYVNLDEGERVAVLDQALRIENQETPDVSEFYADPLFASEDVRLEWMEKTPADFKTSDDPFIKLAVALYDYDMAREEEAKQTAGKLQSLRPRYMEAIIAFNKAAGKAVYPDANSTLRFTYGKVLGGSPQDGLEYLPFTTLEGIVAKDTGIEPFNSPKSQLDLIKAGTYGDYALKDIGSVPVNFLADLDITGGNSGSPALNAMGELVGLLFDGTYESINSDWDFDVKTTRSIQVDVRYMLWVMKYMDGADRLLEEMNVH